VAQHRQLNVIAYRCAFLHVENKLAYALLCIFEKEEHPILQAGKFTGHERQDLALNSGIAAGCCCQCAFFDRQDFSVRDYFRREGVFLSTLEAKVVTWQIKTDNLVTPITQGFAGKNRAANDFVNARCRVTCH
jgi:hypothetical protein